MKKRIFSVVLSLVFIIASISTAFAAPQFPLEITDEAQFVYEGNKPFILAEELIDELYADKEEDELFDMRAHTFQHGRIKAVNRDLFQDLTTEELTDKLSDAIDHIIGEDSKKLSPAQKMYLYSQVHAIDDPAFKARLDEVDPVGGESLKRSFDLLNDYIADMRNFFNDEGITRELYENDPVVQERARAIVAEPLIAILKVMFPQDGTSVDTSYYTESGLYMRENYLKKFIDNDRAKKTLSVLFGAELTEEIVRDSFIPGVNPDDELIGIVHHVKKYLSENDPALADVKRDVENMVLVPGASTSVRGAFDALGEVVVKAYEYDQNASEELKNDVKMLMGDGENKGLIELMIEAVDRNFAASNIWLNLFLSEFVQADVENGDTLDTINATNQNPTPAEIRNGAHINFDVENLSDYGIEDDRISLRTGKFSLRFYIVDPSTLAAGSGYAGGSGGSSSSTPSSGGASSSGSEPSYDGYIESGSISYSSSQSKITVKYDKNFDEGQEYQAYMVLYRSSTVAKETFIESYPVTVVNPHKPSSSGGSSKVYINYNTNGGEPISSTSHTRGSVVEINKVPVREGYIFTGWYSDEALTQKIDSITVIASTTVYAGWKKDGSTVVSVVDIPELLDGEHHYAYIMGYPEGDVRPYGNITRAETATMLFRLLDDDVRTANLKETNNFIDVDDTDWFNTSVSTLAGLGIINGRTSTKFMPNEYITRAEFATMFARLAEYEYKNDGSYTDVDGHWAEEYIYEASAYGWIAGYEDNTFRPNKAINRAEAMTLVNRVLKRIPQSKDDLLSGMTVWVDNADESAWYYVAVQEATNSHDHVMKNEAYEKWTMLTENKDWTVFEK